MIGGSKKGKKAAEYWFQDHILTIGVTNVKVGAVIPIAIVAYKQEEGGQFNSMYTVLTKQ